MVVAWWLCGGLLVVWCFAPLVALLIDVRVHGGVLSGSDGASAGADQFQYLAWIRESGAHGAIADAFELSPSRAVFVHPMFLISGLLSRLGLGLQLAYLLWKPVAAAALLCGFGLFVARALRGWAALAALAVALFYLTPLLPVLDWANALHGWSRFDLVLGAEELSPAWQLWGYLPAALAIGLLPLALLASERALAASARDNRWAGRWSVWAAAAGVLVSWLHPWQGATLVLVWAGVAIWGRSWRSSRSLIVPVAAALAPLLYYEVLAHADAAWRLADRQNTTAHLPAWALAAALAPLALLALPAFLRRPADVFGRFTRLWVASALVVYFAERSFPFHALEGLSLPLAILAVEVWVARPARRSRVTIAAASAVTATVVLAAVWSALYYRDNVDSHAAPYTFTAQERGALAYLERAPHSGGVLASYYLGMAVPAFTGRSTWVGHYIWTPQFVSRALLAESLFNGRLTPTAAGAFIRASGARYVLDDCGPGADLPKLLPGVLLRRAAFGCVTVYELEAPNRQPSPATAHVPHHGG
jgi:hypothetical protein